MTAAVFTDAYLFTDAFLRRFLTGVILAMVAVVVAVAGIAFFTSFEAIRAFAETSGGINPDHAWMAPLLVDSFIFIASAADLWLTITGANRHTDNLMQAVLVWAPKALLAAAAAGSFALNIAHAEPHIGAQAIAVLAPIALVVTFEILMMVVRRAAAARVERLRGDEATFTAAQVARMLRRSQTAAVAPEAPAVPPTPPAPAATPNAPATQRPRPVPIATQRLGDGELSPADAQALDRARKDPVKVQATTLRRGIDPQLVMARPQRWPWPSDNGDGSHDS